MTLTNPWPSRIPGDPNHFSSSHSESDHSHISYSFSTSPDDSLNCTFDSEYQSITSDLTLISTAKSASTPPIFTDEDDERESKPHLYNYINITATNKINQSPSITLHIYQTKNINITFIITRIINTIMSVTKQRLH